MKFAVENFKIFKERQEFDIRPITILVGPNGSGKSSLVNALNLINSFQVEPSLKISQHDNSLIPNRDKSILKKIEIINLERLKRPASRLEHLLNKYSENNSIVFEFETEYYFGKELSNISLSLFYEANKEMTTSQAILTDLLVKDKNSGNTIFRLTYVDQIKSYAFEFNINFLYQSYKNGAGSILEVQNIKLNYFDNYLYSSTEKEYKLFKIENPFIIVNNHDGYEESISLEKFKKQKGYELAELPTKISEDLKDKDYLMYSLSNSDLANFEDVVLKNLIFNFCQDVENVFLDYSEDLNGQLAKIFFQEFCFGTFLHIVTMSIEDFTPYNFIGVRRNFGDNLLSLMHTDINESELQKYFRSAVGMGDSAKKAFHEVVLKYLGKAYFNIAEEFELLINEDGYSGVINLIKKGSKINLREEGFGVINLIPILFAMSFGHIKKSPNLNKGIKWIDQNSINLNTPFFVIEEPEMNLHPNYQSKLADLFSDSIITGHLYLVLETHSEYLIRRFQYLVAKGELKKEDIQIYYFNDPSNVKDGEEVVYPININGDGSLTRDFGKGFFDEADNIALDLFLLNQSQKN